MPVRALVHECTLVHKSPTASSTHIPALNGVWGLWHTRPGSGEHASDATVG